MALDLFCVTRYSQAPSMLSQGQSLIDPCGRAVPLTPGTEESASVVDCPSASPLRRSGSAGSPQTSSTGTRVCTLPCAHQLGCFLPSLNHPRRRERTSRVAERMKKAGGPRPHELRSQSLRRWVGECPPRSKSVAQKGRPFRWRGHLVPPNIEISPDFVPCCTLLFFFFLFLRWKRHDVHRLTATPGIAGSFSPSRVQTLPPPFRPRLKVTLDVDENSESEGWHH